MKTTFSIFVVLLLTASFIPKKAEANKAGTQQIRYIEDGNTTMDLNRLKNEFSKSKSARKINQRKLDKAIEAAIENQ
jgi:hypothetical protein